jgi:hypothetical protein
MGDRFAARLAVEAQTWVHDGLLTHLLGLFVGGRPYP